MAIVRARRTKTRLRMGIAGQSKAGKSRTSLIIMTGILEKLTELGEVQGNGRILVIDAERESSTKYAMAHDTDFRDDAYDFDMLPMRPPYSTEAYAKALQEAEKEKYTCVIIDQISHQWNGPGGILESVSESASQPGANPNSFAHWAPATKKHDAFIDAYLAYPWHVICLMRSKVKSRWSKESKEVIKIGVKPIQRENILYEFDAMGQMDHTHTLVMDGSRCPLLDRAKFPMPTKELGHGIAEWLVLGQTATEVRQSSLDDAKVREIKRLFRLMDLDDDDQLSVLTNRGVVKIEDLTEHVATQMIENMSEHLRKLAKEQAYNERIAAGKNKKPAPSSPGPSDSTPKASNKEPEFDDVTTPQVLTKDEMADTIDQLMESSSEPSTETQTEDNSPPFTPTEPNPLITPPAPKRGKKNPVTSKK